MENNRLTLIVDGNWLFMTQIFMCGKELERDTFESYHLLRKNFFETLYATVNRLECCDNWILVSDDGSWRKSIKVPECVTVTYKGQRTPDEKYNWEKIWKTWDDIRSQLSDTGITVARAYEIEGDDWCAYWAGKLRKNGISTIIWSRDHDLKQLVCYDENTWTGWYNNNDGLVLHEDAISLSEFFQVNTKSRALINTVQHYIPDITYICPLKEIIIPKILNGDVSDNIKPIIFRVKNDRTYKLPQKEIPYDINIFDENEVKEFIKSKLNEEKYSSLVFNDVWEHYEYNKRLVVLQSKYYPEYVKKAILENATEYKIAPTQIPEYSDEVDWEIEDLIESI